MITVRPHGSSYLLAWTLITTTTLGIVLSITLTTDARWIEWHLSRLGEGGTIGAAVFNLSFVVAALLLVVLAHKLMLELAPSGRRQLIRGILLAIAFCWVGIALFPFDRFPSTHNFFGYGQFLLIGLLMLRLRHICDRFSQRTYAIGLFGVILTSILLALFHLTHFTTLLAVEVVGQALFSAWLLSMTHDSRDQSVVS